MAYEVGGVGTLAEIEEFYRGQGNKDANILELMNQTNDILSDIQFREANKTDGHETRVRTGLPEIYFRRLYRGTPISKSKWDRVIEGLGMLEGRMELDVKEKELYAEAFGAYRVSEGKAYMEALRQKAACLMFYGNHASMPDEFDGLATRYGALDTPNVIDAGGVASDDGSNLTSMYLVVWGPDTCVGLFPKHSVGGVKHQDLGMYTTQDSEGRKFEVYGDLWSWNLGLAVRDWRAVVRIANIDTTKLGLKYTDEDYLDLQGLTIVAKNKMPEYMRSKAIWYCNSDVLTGLERQSIDPRAVHLTYGEFFGSQAVPMLHHRPIRQCDAILSTETQVVSKA